MGKIKTWDPADSPSGRASNIILESLLKQPVIKCIRCKKKICVDGDCAKMALKGVPIGKGKKTSNTFSSMPFSLISGMWIDSKYSTLCHTCDKFVKRCIGFIPEKWDDEWFPQVSTPWLSIEKLTPEQKRNRWSITYRGKSGIPHSKSIQRSFMNSAVKRYKRSFPECPHTENKLKRLLNGYKLYDKEYNEY